MGTACYTLIVRNWMFLYGGPVPSRYPHDWYFGTNLLILTLLEQRSTDELARREETGRRYSRRSPRRSPLRDYPGPSMEAGPAEEGTRYRCGLDCRFIQRRCSIRCRAAITGGIECRAGDCVAGAAAQHRADAVGGDGSNRALGW